MTAAAETLAESESQVVRFSYASPDQKWLQRNLVRVIERFTGQRRIERLYLDWAATQRGEENVFAAGLRLLDVDLDLAPGTLAAVPRTGPVLFVANHPFGILDGLAIGRITTLVRPDSMIMTNSLLCQPPEARNYLLPIDFSGTREAQITTMKTRRRAMEWLKDGHALVVFPGGGVATSQKPFSGPALEAPWHPFIGKLARVPGVTIVPIYFHGQNSRMFHIASHFSFSLRIALLFRECALRMGKPMPVTIGAPFPSEDLQAIADRGEVMREIRRRTLALGGAEAPDPSLEFVWPAHIDANG
jgi:putative hemolysin